MNILSITVAAGITNNAMYNVVSGLGSAQGYATKVKVNSELGGELISDMTLSCLLSHLQIEINKGEGQGYF